jgi:hypothetical protein
MLGNVERTKLVLCGEMDRIILPSPLQMRVTHSGVFESSRDKSRFASRCVHTGLERGLEHCYTHPP